MVVIGIIADNSCIVFFFLKFHSSTAFILLKDSLISSKKFIGSLQFALACYERCKSEEHAICLI